MAKKYIILQDSNGEIRVKVRNSLGLEYSLRDHKWNKVGAFNSQTQAERHVQTLEESTREAARTKRAAIDQSGVKYIFDAANDEDLTIKVKFRIIRTSKVEDRPFRLQEHTAAGWVYVVHKVEGSIWRRKAKMFSSEAAAKTELLAIVQKMQEVEDYRRRARVLTVIDSRVYDHTEENQIAKPA